MKRKKLLVYTERSYLKPDEVYVPLLFPFWGYHLEPEDFLDRGRFTDYVKKGSECFALVDDPNQADFILSPIGYGRERGPAALVHFARIAEVVNKKVVLFFTSDSDEQINVPHSVIFRTSFYKSQRKSTEYAMPGWSVDFLKHYNNGNLQLRGKKKKPVVGYCGYIDRSSLETTFGLRQSVRRILRTHVLERENTPFFKKLRGDAVRNLHQSAGIDTKIIIRQKYWAREISKNVSRAQYYGNIMNSDYTLVVRGAGNFSYRLYEVLSCGRIPVFINTDCVLPFDDIIDWKQHCVWIEEKEVKDIGRIVNAFHNRIGSTEFQELQIKNRRLYEEWLSPVGFFGNIHRYIVPELVRQGRDI